MTGKPDITYREDGLFVRFMPQTEAGESAWRVMAAHSEGSGAFLISQRAAVITQLRLAGYTVAKAPPLKPMSPGELDALLAELGA